MPGPQISSGTKLAQNFFSDFLPNIVTFSPIFSQKLGEDHKKKRSLLKFSGIFSQKIRWRPKKKKVFIEIYKGLYWNLFQIFFPLRMKTGPNKLNAET